MTSPPSCLFCAQLEALSVLLYCCGCGSGTRTAIVFGCLSTPECKNRSFLPFADALQLIRGSVLSAGTNGCVRVCVCVVVFSSLDR